MFRSGAHNTARLQAYLFVEPYNLKVARLIVVLCRRVEGARREWDRFRDGERNLALLLRVQFEESTVEIETYFFLNGACPDSGRRSRGRTRAPRGLAAGQGLCHANQDLNVV